MNLKTLKHIYFLGIGGIGMSALARYFKSAGISVSGYDKTKTPLTIQLEKEGIAVHYKDAPEMIPVQTELVIYTPAIPGDLRELQTVKEKKLSLKKRSEILGMLSSNKYTVAIAGTHGKTTVTSIITHILQSAGKDIASFAGGIMNNYSSNFIGNASAEIFIAEADEYDRSFLQLKPDIAVITSIDPDHLDIYGSKEELKNSFSLFAGNIGSKGTLIIHKKYETEINTVANKISYSVNQQADIYAEKLNFAANLFRFDIVYGEGRIEEIAFSLPGKHNAENAVAAVAVALRLGVNPDKIKSALQTYSGVKRRFEYILNTPDIVYIDDYAHHPRELEECINAVKNLYPEKKITGIFQPHLYSRTRDFADGFAESLSLLDKVILIPIYPAREKPIEGVSSKIIFDKITIDDKCLIEKNDVLNYLKNTKPEVLLTTGAGDIDQLVEPIKELLK